MQNLTSDFPRQAQPGPLVERSRSPLRSWALGLLAVWLLLGGIYLGGMTFLDRQGTYRHSAATADLDGDGDLDLAVAHLRIESASTFWGASTLWMNQGGGRFTPRENGYYSSIAAGDLDGDGDPDLAALDGSWLALLLNQGGLQGGEPGTFKPIGTAVAPENDHGVPGSIHLGDLDNDGDLDSLVAGCCGMSFQDREGKPVSLLSHSWVWINEWDPHRGLTRRTLSLKPLGDLHLRGAALGDLNRDGSLDLFAALQTIHRDGLAGEADRVFINNGSGGFSDSGQRLGDQDSASAALGDLDGDGDLDALAGNAAGVQVWFNQGGAQAGKAGDFAPSPQEIKSSPVQKVYLADFDQDLDLDALIAGETQAVIWWNDGQGIFARSDQVFRFTKRHALAAADFNADGRVDLIAAAYREAHSLWINLGGGRFQRR